MKKILITILASMLIVLGFTSSVLAEEVVQPVPIKLTIQLYNKDTNMVVDQHILDLQYMPNTVNTFNVLEYYNASFIFIHPNLKFVEVLDLNNTVVSDPQNFVFDLNNNTVKIAVTSSVTNPTPTPEPEPTPTDQIDNITLFKIYDTVRMFFIAYLIFNLYKVIHRISLNFVGGKNNG
ncbi:MAG: hypothetical protein K0Q49_2121 [Haloplasmataceae bacterium]|jgi:hypothetical protein|nr:hypothetical protein [Haloplasmataceae bacterium]